MIYKVCIIENAPILYINLVHLHDGIRLEVGRLLHEAAHQQHGSAFGLQAARIRQGLIFREALGHTLLQNDQGLVDISLKYTVQNVQM